MKLGLLMMACLLVGCASGSEAEPEIEPATENVYHPVTPAPAPVEDAAPAEQQSDCYVVIDWVNNCEVIKLICHNELKKLDVQCAPNSTQFDPHWIPDPPPPWVRGQNKY